MPSKPQPLVHVAAGAHIENTLEALQDLIKRDNATPDGLPKLAYIEFDVHVSNRLRPLKCTST